MKKIINGKRYDTATARLLAVAEAQVESVEDFQYYEEALYRTRRGLYFLHGRGGPMTPYARRHSDGAWGWGEEIFPITPRIARLWCEKHRIDPEEEGFAHLLPPE